MKKEIPIACCHSVFTKEERTAYKSVWGELELRRLGVTELENGFQHEFPGDADTLRLIYEWVGMERKCCPFLTFTVIASHTDEPILLRLTGNQEAKAFLRTDIQGNIDRITRQA